LTRTWSSSIVQGPLRMAAARSGGTGTGTCTCTTAPASMADCMAQPQLSSDPLPRRAEPGHPSPRDFFIVACGAGPSRREAAATLGSVRLTRKTLAGRPRYGSLGCVSRRNIHSLHSQLFRAKASGPENRALGRYFGTGESAVSPWVSCGK
jgi:hypothetical protein